MGKLLLLFIVVPMVELALLIRLGEIVGLGNTLLLIIFTGFVGANLARQQGLRVVRDVQQEMSAGRMPATAMAEGVLLLVAGALLITPGVLTDVFGFACLVPPVRRLMAGYLMRRFSRSMETGQGSFFFRVGGPAGPGFQPPSRPPPPGDGPVIDVTPERDEPR